MQLNIGEHFHHNYHDGERTEQHNFMGIVEACVIGAVEAGVITSMAVADAVIAIGTAAITGATIGAGLSVVTQLAMTGKVDWDKVGQGTWMGAAGGAVTGAIGNAAYGLGADAKAGTAADVAASADASATLNAPVAASGDAGAAGTSGTAAANMATSGANAAATAANALTPLDYARMGLSNGLTGPQLQSYLVANGVDATTAGALANNSSQLMNVIGDTNQFNQAATNAVAGTSNTSQVMNSLMGKAVTVLQNGKVSGIATNALGALTSPKAQQQTAPTSIQNSLYGLMPTARAGTTPNPVNFAPQTPWGSYQYRPIGQ